MTKRTHTLLSDCLPLAHTASPGLLTPHSSRFSMRIARTLNDAYPIDAKSESAVKVDSNDSSSRLLRI